MAYPTGSRGGNFVSRVKTIDRPNSYTSLYKTVNNEIYDWAKNFLTNKII